MKVGLFCFYEDHHHDFSRAVAEQTALVRHAESLGFDEAWVAEHHFNDYGVSPSVLLLLAHLAALTSRIRLGSAALLLPFHDPIRVAEDVATLDHLSGGRLNLGIAHGGPFPAQNLHFKVPEESARARTLEALELLSKLLYAGPVSHSGEHFRLEGVTLQPRPLQHPIPVFLATQNTAAVEAAARHGYGLMGGQGADPVKLADTLRRYREIAPETEVPLVLLRSFFVAQTHDAALATAVPALQRFRERMRPHFKDPGPFPPGGETSSPFLTQGIIGNVQECRDAIRRLQDTLGDFSLVLKPAALDPHAACHSLTLFNEQVRPHL